MSADTAPNVFHSQQAAGVDAEMRVDTPTMDRLRRAKRERRWGSFLKGPVPLERIARAVSISGRALALLLAIHFQVDVSGQQWVRLTEGLLSKVGLTRDDKKRWLTRLAEAGLIDINNRGRGRATQVRLRNDPKQKRGSKRDKTETPKLNFMGRGGFVLSCALGSLVDRPPRRPPLKVHHIIQEIRFLIRGTGWAVTPM